MNKELMPPEDLRVLSDEEYIQIKAQHLESSIKMVQGMQKRFERKGRDKLRYPTGDDWNKASHPWLEIDRRFINEVSDHIVQGSIDTLNSLGQMDMVEDILYRLTVNGGE